MKKILITGSTGFIGEHLVRYLLQKQLSVRILARDAKKANALYSGVEVHIGDLTDPLSLKKSCQDIDAIFHLGGYAHAADESNLSFANKHLAINFQGTKNILKEAIRAGVKKFIFFSTVKAVADSEAYIDEQWENYPTSPYGIAKREAEKIVLAAGQQGMHVCILRPALVYGSGWKGNLGNMMRAIERGLFPPIPETHNRRSMISVKDLCEAAYLAAHHPSANGKIYFVTDGKCYSSRQLYELMSEALGKKVPTWHIPLILFKMLSAVGDLGAKIYWRLPFNSETMTKLFGSAQYNSQRLENELGFKPIYDLKKMLPVIIMENKTCAVHED